MSILSYERYRIFPTYCITEEYIYQKVEGDTMKLLAILIFLLSIIYNEQVYAKFLSDEGTLEQRGVALYYIIDNKEYQVAGVKLSGSLSPQELTSLTTNINKVLLVEFKNKYEVELITSYRQKDILINYLLIIYNDKGGGSIEGEKFYESQAEIDYINQVLDNTTDLTSNQYIEVMTRLLKL